MSKLQELRKKAGLSQSQLSNLAGINLRMLQKYEIANRDINKAQAITIYRLAKALKVPMEELIEID